MWIGGDLERTTWKALPSGSYTVSSNSDPGHPRAKSRSVSPVVVAPGWTPLSAPWFRLLAASAAGAPCVVSAVWLKTVQESVRSVGGIGAGWLGCCCGATVVERPL